VYTDPETFDLSHNEIVGHAVNMSLGIILFKYIIFIIVKFARFNLLSSQFFRQSTVAVIMGVLGLVLYLAGQDYADCIFVGAEMAVSVGICIYVVTISRRM
jgi:small-conductance mechanosensitive channel